MLAEPFNLVLWHVAAMANACSNEVAERGSPKWYRNIWNVTQNPIYIRHLLPNDVVRLSDLDGQNDIQIELSNFSLTMGSGNFLPISIDPISSVLRDYHELINGYIHTASQSDLDFTAIDTTMDLRDDALANLRIFHPEGIAQLLDVNRLSSIVEMVLSANSSQTLTSYQNTFKMRLDMRNDLREICKRLTNSLVFDVVSKIA